MRRRPLLYALLALAVPLPALALTGGGEAGGEPPVSRLARRLRDLVRLDRLQDRRLLERGRGRRPGTPPASPGRRLGRRLRRRRQRRSSSFWVPYAGNGTYTVTVSAYGTPPGSDEPEVIAEGSSDDGGDDGADTEVKQTDAEVTVEDATGEPPPRSRRRRRPQIRPRKSRRSRSARSPPPPCPRSRPSEPPAEADGDGRRGRRRCGGRARGRSPRRPTPAACQTARRSVPPVVHALR